VDVYEAVRSRQSVRGFTSRPVDRDILARVLLAASRAPSGGNLQPWHVYVLCGDRLSELKRRVAQRVAAGDTAPPVLRMTITSPVPESVLRTGTALVRPRRCSAISTAICPHHNGEMRECICRP
jgi:nitroreductase